MLSHDDFAALTTSPVRTPSGPPVLIAGPAAREEANAFALRVDSWWLNEGVDPRAAHAWCMEQAEEDLGLYASMVMLGHDPMVLMGSQLATAYQLGLTMGWRLRERKP